ncbi:MULTISPECIES: DUF2231 domain-containing protein [Kribbella]|jgi:uncharacterized membrane protein|uniref:Membrane protein n=1 Tax=Kribbella pratensis TaxID=2512112 RepID=A0ABY2FJP8_9ACTN|nr:MULTISPECIES: DUF2231 domain-containing protein [Kribbella]TDW86582.1 putative membrane protein [Kribbella sp. VKM Ac-2566]TDW93349.1 putative membrane protein [Kribbella pratensis]
MSDRQTAAKRPVSALLTGPYGHPFHPVLVTIPIGAWVASFVFDIGSRAASDASYLVRSSEWLIVIGIVGALAAASVGLLDFFTLPSGTRAFRTGLIHLTLNVAITLAYAANAWWRHGEEDQVAIGPVVLSGVSLVALGISGYLGGKLAFRYGVRVAEEQDQAEGFEPRS